MGVFGQEQIARSESNTMTIGGTVSATAILLAIVSATGIFTWQQMVTGGPLTKFIWPVMIGSFIGGIGVSLMIYTKPKMARVIAPIHAILQGVFVGALSYIIPTQFLGNAADPNTGNAMQTLIVQAILATFGIAGGMLLGYATGIIRVGPVFQKVMITAAIGVILYIIALFLLPFIGINIWNGYADTGMMGIGFTGICVALASLFLVLDFQYIEQGVKTGQPKYMEWVGAWGLMVTLVWLYIEILRLLSKLQSRD
ncbi:unnamed protein product [Symbiodinium sp. CCMP2592]|nr:unnamed protein product [Symbiodinium sp. CCMP2592]